MEDAYLVDFCNHNQNHQAKNNDFWSSRAGDKDGQMDALQKLYSEKKKSSSLESAVKKNTKLLVEIRLKPEKLVATKQVLEDAVAAKSTAEKRVV